MTRQLQAVDDPRTDQNFRQLGERFPIQQEDLAAEAVGPEQMSTEAEQRFPQLVSAGDVKLSFGQVEVEWTAKGIASAAKTVTHGIGKTPRPFGTPEAFAGGYAETASANTTTFEIRVVSTTGEIAAGTKRKVNWWAIG